MNGIDPRYSSPPHFRQPLENKTPPRGVVKDVSAKGLSGENVEQVPSSPKNHPIGSEIFTALGKENTPPRLGSIKDVTLHEDGIIGSLKLPGFEEMKVVLEEGLSSSEESFESILNSKKRIGGSLDSSSKKRLLEQKERSLFQKKVPFSAVILDSSFDDIPVDLLHEEPEAVAMSAPSTRLPKGAISNRKQLSVISFEPVENSDPFFSRTTLEELGAESIPEDLGIDGFFSEKEMALRQIASGAFGIVYDVTSTKDTSSISEISLVYKEEIKPKLLTGGANQKIWRHGDAAPVRIEPPLPRLARVRFFVFEVTDVGRKTEKFYLPASSAREFATHLPSSAKVRLIGQIMEKAPGKNLEELMNNKKGLSPDDADFLNILLAVDDFLRAAYGHNFIHRDLKPANIMYDPESGVVTIIDTGESSRLRQRGKSDVATKMSQGHRSNPTSSTIRQGTRNFMAPSIAEGKAYGSEVDFFSEGMILLKLINPNDFKKVSDIRSQAHIPMDDPFFGEDPINFLEIYLHLLGPESQTRQILNEHPQIKQLIDLYFQTSAGGTSKQIELSQQAFNQSQEIITSLRAELEQRWPDAMEAATF